MAKLTRQKRLLKSSRTSSTSSRRKLLIDHTYHGMLILCNMSDVATYPLPAVADSSGHNTPKTGSTTCVSTPTYAQRDTIKHETNHKKTGLLPPPARALKLTSHLFLPPALLHAIYLSTEYVPAPSRQLSSGNGQPRNRLDKADVLLKNNALRPSASRTYHSQEYFQTFANEVYWSVTLFPPPFLSGAEVSPLRASFSLLFSNYAVASDPLVRPRLLVVERRAENKAKHGIFLEVERTSSARGGPFYSSRLGGLRSVA